MTKSLALRTAGRFLIGLCICATLASAATITATGVDWNRGAGLWISEDGSPQDAYFAGVVLINLNENGQQYNRDTMCVDLFTDIYLGVTYDTDLVNPGDVPGRNLNRVAWLLANALLPTQGPVYSSLLPSSDWVTNSAQGAGLQLAIWDITTDGGDGFSAGRVQASTTAGELTDPATLAWAETYEKLSVGKTDNDAFVYINSGIGSGTPAQMLEGPIFRDGGPSPVPDPQTPEPATCVLAGVALVGIGLSRRRGQRASRQD